MTRTIPWALIFILASWAVAPSPPASAEAVECPNPKPYLIEVENQVGDSPGSADFCGFFCDQPQHLGNEIFLRDPFCDPTAGPCSVTISVPFEFPGNADNVAAGGSSVVPRLYYFESASAPDCTPTFFDNCGAFAICGAPGGPQFLTDFGRTLITLGGISCNNVGSIRDVVSLTAWRCLSTSCRSHTDVDGLAFGGPEVARAIGCPLPPPEACNGDAQCNTCAVGGVGVGGGGPGITLGGPGATLRYKAGGTGTSGLPGASGWSAELGRGWSHDYAERIVQAPDPSHVFLLTRFGTFKEFSDPESDGTYVASPSDEYRTLTFDAATGWELTDLDGTVQRFDLSGRWFETVDRNGNLTQGFYDPSDRLEEVTFPDGRSETFAYDGVSGKLATITEVGVDGTTTRTWTLDWTGDDLTRLDRPDGTAVELFYDDPSHPGFLTRQDLVGSSGGRRVMRAWEYGPQGNVSATWRGDVAQDGPDAVDLYQIAYDDPIQPTVTTVTDPLGKPGVYSFDRDPASTKVRMQTISGDCPVCGLGPSSTFTYADDDNPLRPTTITDGLGHMTLLQYDEHGQVVMRTEALGTLQERDTIWTYDPSFPALVSSIERPSVAGGASMRRTDLIRDASGNVTERMETGVEDGTAFMLSTVMSYETSGETLTIDPPGFGTGDVTSFAYDAARGDLIPLLRTDPLIGTTTFAHDAFNRRTEVTDPNGVTTATDYDPLDRVTQVVQEGATAAEDLVTTNEYNEFGDLERTTLPRGNVLEYGYDPAGRLILIERKPDAATPAERTLFTLDAVGHRVGEELQRWDGSQWVTEAETAFVYSTRCHLDQVIQAPGTPQESITEHAYDCNGNLERTWDANHPRFGTLPEPDPGDPPPPGDEPDRDPALWGRLDSGTMTENPATQVFVYDELHRLIETRQPWAGPEGGEAVTTYGYDVQDHLVSVIDAEGNETTYEYSDRDLLIRETSPVSGLTTHHYNGHGELTETTDARGVTVARTVDELDRVELVDYPGTDLDTTFVYDDPSVDFSLGRLTSIQRHGQSVDYRYDRFGRLTQDGQLGYAYDPNGNRTEMTYPGGLVARYEYDFADRQETLEVEEPGQAPVAVVAAATYLPSGPLANLTLGNGLSEIRTFDGRYFPAGIEVSGLVDWTYSTDRVGNVTQVEGLSAGNHFLAAFEYLDVAYFLTRGDGPWGEREWSFDKIGNRLTSASGLEGEYFYDTNAGGGNSAKLTSVEPLFGSTSNWTFGYTDAGHQDQVTFEPEPGDVRTETSTYDAEGRLAGTVPADGLSQVEMTYDGRSFLTEAEQTFAGSTDFMRVTPTYSSEGLLYSLAEASQTTSTAPPDSDEGGGAGGTTTVDRVTHVLYFAGRPVGQWVQQAGQDAQLLLLTTDHLGAPILATDLSGGQVWSGWLEPFGEPVDLRPPSGGGGDGDPEGDTDADQPTDPPPPPPDDPGDDGRDDPPPPEGDPDGRDEPAPDPGPSDPNPNPDGRDEPPPDPGPSEPNPNPDGRDEPAPTDPEEPNDGRDGDPPPPPPPSDPNPNPDGRLVLQIPPAASIEEAGIFLRYPGQWEHEVFRSQATDGIYYNVHRWYEPGAGRYIKVDPRGILRPLGLALLYTYGNGNPVYFIDPDGLDALTDNPMVQDCFYCLLASAGFGVQPWEAAAFVTEEEAGEMPIYGCLGWPSSRATAEQTYKGVIPNNMVAIAHTHPTRSRKTSRTGPKPSSGDKALAKDQGVPIYTISPGGIWKYDPGTNQTTLEAPSSWTKEPKKRCKDRKPCEGVTDFSGQF